ncbi:MAG: UvrD-helicase domain-containing protein [Christensenellaceae bacterium]|jgi:ATP-dependent helicase/nuclease subunit A|nr:UvrD-helicase domain-containing protein [Christensenellaceae bacterium]
MTKWTTAQANVIKSDAKKLLVSASAGSGKTSTMIERIIRRILDEGVSLNEVLVLTFTKESASDVRGKLRAALEKEFANEKDENIKSRLEKELLNLCTAEIGTFHSFCGDIIRQNFQVLTDISADFAIVDEVETSRLMQGVIISAIAENYDAARETVDLYLASRKYDALIGDIIMLSSKFESIVDVDDWLETVGFACYNEDIDGGLALKTILADFIEIGQNFYSKFANFKDFAETPAGDKTKPFVEHCLEAANQLMNLRSYDDLHELATKIKFDTLKGDREAQEYVDFKDLRTEFKELVLGSLKHFEIDKTTAQKNIARDKKVVEGLVFLTKKFIAEYSALKKRRNLLDFADLERLALEVLKSPQTKDLFARRFKYVFVDEFQDVNKIQEEIVARVSGEGTKVFIVGDVKQSIYGFRGCDPDIFAQKINGGERGASVELLNFNFRSSPDILEFCNRVFTPIMREETAGVNYADSSKFTSGLGAYKNEITPYNIDIIEREPREKVEVSGIYNILGETEISDEVKTIAAEAELVARYITQVQGKKIFDAKKGDFRAEPVSFSDIAVLARNSTHFNALSVAFRRHGINFVLDKKTKANEIAEISALNSFLFSCVNPTNDTPIVLCMQSVLFGFSCEELAQIKLCAKEKISANERAGANEKTNFYEQIQNYIETKNDELSKRLVNFVATLKKYNGLAKNMTVSEILRVFVAETRAIERFSLAGYFEAQNNIEKYIDAVNKPIGESISAFLYLLEQGLIEIEIPSGGVGEDAVRVMTIHHSKGLEFPIVIVFDVSANFSSQDERKMLLFDKNLGLSMASYDADNFVRTGSLARIAMKIGKKRETIADEMRLLYVALTRAQNALYIVGSSKPRKSVNGSLSLFDIKRAGNMLDFLYLSNAEFNYIKKDSIEVLTADTTSSGVSIINDTKLDLSFNYANELATKTPTKSTVTSLTKTEIEDAIDIPKQVYLGKDRGAEYGTIFHKKMQRLIARGEFPQNESEPNIIIENETDPNVIRALPIISELISGSKTYAEVPFIKSETQNGEKIVVQGVIDLIAVFADRAIVIDYKTTKGSEAHLKELYSGQLNYYKSAAAEFLLNLPIETYIYSTHLAKLIKL